VVATTAVAVLAHYCYTLPFKWIDTGRLGAPVFLAWSAVFLTYLRWPKTLALSALIAVTLFPFALWVFVYLFADDHGGSSTIGLPLFLFPVMGVGLIAIAGGIERAILSTMRDRNRRRVVPPRPAHR
jgi:hypothetical protein